MDAKEKAIRKRVRRCNNRLYEQAMGGWKWHPPNPSARKP